MEGLRDARDGVPSDVIHRWRWRGGQASQGRQEDKPSLPLFALVLASVFAALCSWENFKLVMCLACLVFVLDYVVVGCSWRFAMKYLEFWAGTKESDLCML